MSVVQVIPLGGVGEIGKNCTVVRQDDDLIVVDVGLSFPNEEMLGVDIVIPDFTYLVENKDKIRVLAIADNQRFPDFPDTPTFKEAGIDMVEAIDRGVGAPPGTPDYVIKKLEAAFLEIARNPDIQAEMKKQGFVPLAMGHQESKDHIQKMTEVYKALVAEIKK